MPYGMARPRLSPRKSWTLTAIGSRLQVWPACLKSPINSFLLAVDVQRIVQLAQQAADRGWAERVASLFQAVAQRPQAAAHPFLGAHRIAGCFGSDQSLQRGHDQRCFLLGRQTFRVE